MKKVYQIDHLTSSENIEAALAAIEAKLDQEIISKQNTIEKLESEFHRLNTINREKTAEINALHLQLAECKSKNEGNRQLINKLLGDIERLNLDIDWYKRTYEKRSLLGTLREKLFRKRF